MSVQSYPWTVRIYKGEGRFLIVEEVEHRAGYNTYSDKITIRKENIYGNNNNHSFCETL